MTAVHHFLGLRINLQELQNYIPTTHCFVAREGIGIILLLRLYSHHTLLCSQGGYREHLVAKAIFPPHTAL